MKRNITIEIDIDTEQTGWTALTGVAPDKFQITIRKDINDLFGTEHAVHITMAHEFGHIIGHVFGLPGASQEPRGLFAPKIVSSTPENKQLVLNSENEAWDIAEIILCRSRAIETYKKAKTIS